MEHFNIKEYQENLTDRFLDLYKQLEHEGRKVYFPDSNEKEGIMGRLMAVPQLKDSKDQLDYCRVIRNFLVHTPRVNGLYPIHPSKEMIDLLESCVIRIKNPQLAIDYAIKRENMYTASLDTKVSTVSQHMAQRNFTHVPVLIEGKLLGVFSSDTLYSYISANKTITIDENTIMNAFLEYIPIQSHINEYFVFLPYDTTLYHVSKLFRIDAKSMKQLSAIFLTKNGRSEENILAMITPWSLLRDAPEI